jgi:hypothetical protein
MRKLFLALAFVFVGASSASYGQKSTTKPAEAKHLKKDGTPDKRYKENKNAEKAAAGPTKKDGTPDMRYKANNPAAGKGKK